MKHTISFNVRDIMKLASTIEIIDFIFSEYIETGKIKTTITYMNDFIANTLLAFIETNNTNFINPKHEYHPSLNILLIDGFKIVMVRDITLSISLKVNSTLDITKNINIQMFNSETISKSSILFTYIMNKDKNILTKIHSLSYSTNGANLVLERNKIHVTNDDITTTYERTSDDCMFNCNIIGIGEHLNTILSINERNYRIIT